MENTQTKWQRFWSGVTSAIPVIALVGSIVAAGVSGFFNFYGSQTAQAQTVRELQENQKQLKQTIEERKTERDRQFEEIKKSMLTKELFDVYHKGDLERMERMEKMLERLLEK